MKLWSPIRTMIAFLFHRSQAEREMEEELRSHLRSRADDLERQGIPRAEAERRARIEFGGYQRCKEECREALGSRLLGEVIADVRYGLRQLRRNPGFAAVAVITLALGIGANTAIFSMINGLFLHPAGIADPAHLFVIRVKYSKLNLKSIPISAPDYGDILKNAQVFSSAAAENETSMNYLGSGGPVRLAATEVSWQWFNAFGARPLLGRTFVQEEDQPHANAVTILSYSAWKQLFGGDPAVVGKVIQLNRQPYKVVGVMGPDFDWPRRTELWLPLALAPAAFSPRNYFNEQYFVVARSRPDVPPARATAYVQLLTHRLVAENIGPYGAFAKASGWGMFALPFTEYAAGNLRTPMLVLLGAVGFVLLIACFNIAGLILARRSARAREFAIRVALGAQRRDLFRQMVIEGLLLTGSGAFLGLLAAYGVAGVLPRLLPSSLSSGVVMQVDGHVLLFAVALAVLAGLFLGLIPVGRSFAARQHSVLKEEARAVASSRVGSRVREVLVAGQVALTLILLVGAGLLLKSLAHVAEVNAGFDPRGVMTATVQLPANQYRSDKKRAAFYRAVVEHLASLPGVSSAALSEALPFSGFTPSSSFLIDGRALPPGAPDPHSYLDWVTPGYFRTMRIPLLKGRLFTDADRLGIEPVVVIDENLARRYWPHSDAIGQRVRFVSGSPWATVVGVVAHIDRSALVGDSESGVRYYPMLQQPLSQAFVMVKTPSDPARMGNSIRAAVAAVDPAEPVANLKTLEQYVAGSLGPQRIEVTLLGIFSGIALFLAAVGLYGVISYSVTQRTHEIGIRMALGAQRDDVLRMVVGQGLKLALIGIAIGIAGALGLTRFLSSLLYRVKPADPLTFVVVSLILIGVALVACCIPARRAANVDPMEALRYE